MSKDNTYGKNMKLFTSYWGDKDTFKLMAVNNDCPFMEVIYDPSTTLLVVMSNQSKQNYQMLAKLDDDGNQVACKKPKANGKPFKEQRVLMDVLQEYYIIDPVEQEAFINEFAVNADTYNYKRFLRDMDKEPSVMQVEKPSIVSENGQVLSSK
jgi:hypothetical protein